MKKLSSMKIMVVLLFTLLFMSVSTVSYEQVSVSDKPRLFFLGDSLTFCHPTAPVCDANDENCTGGAGWRNNLFKLTGGQVYDVRGPFGEEVGTNENLFVFSTTMWNDYSYKVKDQVQTAHCSQPGARSTHYPETSPYESVLPDIRQWFYDSDFINEYFPKPNPAGSIIFYFLGANDKPSISYETDNNTKKTRLGETTGGQGNKDTMVEAVEHFIDYVSDYDPTLNVVVLTISPASRKNDSWPDAYPNNYVNIWLEDYNNFYLIPMIQNHANYNSTLFYVDLHTPFSAGGYAEKDVNGNQLYIHYCNALGPIFQAGTIIIGTESTCSTPGCTASEPFAERWYYPWDRDYAYDGAHFSEVGEQIVAQNIYDVLISADLVPKDLDNDGVYDDVDNCPDVANPNQDDSDNDSIGDKCDSCPGCGGCSCGYCEPGCEGECIVDSDNDGISDADDNCPDNCNTQQRDADTDGIGDVCDSDPRCKRGGVKKCEVEC
jgi:hypothetical protein